MYSIVKLETINNFLSYYGVDINNLTSSQLGIISILSNILFLIFWFIVVYILYRVICRLFG